MGHEPMIAHTARTSTKLEHMRPALDHDAITELVETWQLPLGTPVYIHD